MTKGTGLAGVETAVETVVLPAVEAHGLTLVDLEIRGNGRRMAVRIYVDKPGGVTITDCQELSHEVGDLIDVSNLVPTSYDLEVSSPGLDRELRKDRELRWAVGRRVRLWTREPVDGHRELSGRLTVVDESALTLATPDGPGRVPRSLVAKARLEMEPQGSA
ncbi:MAG TPA: ribosome maturation factor RimP [Methylomirabilota bacterium]